MAKLPARGVVALAVVPIVTAVALGAFAAARAAVPTVTTHRLELVPASTRRTMTWVGAVASTRQVRIGLVLGASRPAALASYSLAVATPGSAQYHHFLSASQMERRFGPTASVVVHDRRTLAALGFRDVRRQAAILYATAPATVVEGALNTALGTARADGLKLIVPTGAVSIPASLSDVDWVTGVVEAVGRPAAARAAPPVRAMPISRLASPSASAAATTNLADGYAATSAVIGPDSVPTGLPVTIRTTVTAPMGTGDTLLRIEGYDIVKAPSQSSLSDAEVEGPDNAGDVATTFTAYDPGTYQIEASLQPGFGEPAQTVQLPPVTFTGAVATKGPIDAAQVNTALSATKLVAGAATRPAKIAVFATTTPDLSDVDTYTSENHLSALHIKALPIDGGASANSNDDGELSLDLESLATASPGATVDVYDVPANYSGSGDPFVDVMNAVAAADDVSVLSMSYAQGEMAGSEATAIQQAVEALNAEGITVVTGAGDNGAYGVVGSGTATPVGVASSPADTPQVTAVGGVDLRINASGGGDLATSYWGGEVYAALNATFLKGVLSQSNSAGNVLGGGGYSRVFKAPAWQASLVAAAPGGSGGGRGVPDLAMPAAPDYPGVAMVIQGMATVTGGTSMAAPLFAGYLADMAAANGSGFGDVNPDLYVAAASNKGLMTQALFGYDGKWSLKPGAAWNPLTGLGTPNVDRLAKALAVPATSAVTALAALPAKPRTLAVGDTLAARFTATTAAGAPASGVHLSFSVTGSLAASGLASATGVTNSQGQATVIFQAGGPGSGTIVATAPSGVHAATALLTVVGTRLTPLTTASAAGIATGVQGDRAAAHAPTG
jgi:subtilase family serine protease